MTGLREGPRQHLAHPAASIMTSQRKGPTQPPVHPAAAGRDTPAQRSEATHGRCMVDERCRIFSARSRPARAIAAAGRTGTGSAPTGRRSMFRAGGQRAPSRRSTSSDRLIEPPRPDSRWRPRTMGRWSGRRQALCRRRPGGGPVWALASVRQSSLVDRSVVSDAYNLARKRERGSCPL